MTPAGFELHLVVVAALVASCAWAETPCPRGCRACVRGVADCSKQSLTVPPQAYPEATRTVNLEGNHIRMLGSRSFKPLPELEVLKVNGNKITSLRNDAFKQMKNLITLDLTGNRIFRIYRRSLRGLRKLRTLTLNRNRIQTLTRLFEPVPNLYQLNLAKNRIRSLAAADLAPMTKLRNIDLRDNKIANIHANAFKDLTMLRYLFLNNNPLVSLPALHWGSQVLTLVDLSHCKLVAMPTPLPASVADLRLGNNKIEQVHHTDLLNMTNLQMLALNDNSLAFVADGAFSHLANLMEIWLRGNRLVYLPRDLPDNLRKLHMDSNMLEGMTEGSFSANSRIEYLTVENNRINNLDGSSLSGLKFLAALNFQGNQISTLETDTFRELGSLSQLFLSNNPLERIEPGAFHNLANLSMLQLSHLTEEEFELGDNFLGQMLRLTSLGLMNSPGLAQRLMDLIDDDTATNMVLSHVTSLDFSYNNLERVSPRVLTVFPNLRSLALDGNPLRCDQSLRWLSDWMRVAGREIKFYNYEEPLCENPPHLRGELVSNVREQDWRDAMQGDQPVEARGYPDAMRRLQELQRDYVPPTEENEVQLPQDLILDDDEAKKIKGAGVKVREYAKSEGRRNHIEGDEDEEEEIREKNVKKNKKKGGRKDKKKRDQKKKEKKGKRNRKRRDVNFVI